MAKNIIVFRVSHLHSLKITLCPISFLILVNGWIDGCHLGIKNIHKIYRETSYKRSS